MAGAVKAASRTPCSQLSVKHLRHAARHVGDCDQSEGRALGWMKSHCAVRDNGDDVLYKIKRRLEWSQPVTSQMGRWCGPLNLCLCNTAIKLHLLRMFLVA